MEPSYYKLETMGYKRSSERPPDEMSRWQRKTLDLDGWI